MSLARSFMLAAGLAALMEAVIALNGLRPWQPARPAAAGDIDGPTLYERCTAKVLWKEMWCLGFVAGITESMKTGAHAGARACLPDGLGREQAKSALVPHLRRPRTSTPPSGSVLVARALAEAFPCPADMQTAADDSLR